jgi:hemerythrin
MLTWTDDLALGDDAIDDDHRTAVALMHEIAGADDSRVAGLFEAFVAHMREHFERENALMRASAFPAQHCHFDEHTRVLALLDAIAADVAAGRPEAARRFAADAGPAWFIDHRNTMDLVTVTWARGRPQR